MGRKVECPICKHMTLDKPRVLRVEEKAEAARTLYEAGFSHRQIMRLLGYKSPRSIQDFLDPRHKHGPNQPLSINH